MEPCASGDEQIAGASAGARATSAIP